MDIYRAQLRIKAIVAVAIILLFFVGWSAAGRLDMDLDLDIDSMIPSGATGPSLLLETVSGEYLLLETGYYVLLE